MNSILSFCISLVSFLVLAFVGNATTNNYTSNNKSVTCVCSKDGGECKNTACPNCKCGDNCKCGTACKCNDGNAAATTTTGLALAGMGLSTGATCKSSCPNCKCGDNCKCGTACKCCKADAKCCSNGASATAVAHKTTKAAKRKAKSCESSSCCKAS